MENAGWKKVDYSEHKMEQLQGRLAMLNEAVERMEERLDIKGVLQEVVDSARVLTDARYGAIAIWADTLHDFRVNWAPVDEDYPSWFDPSGNAFPTTSSYTLTDLVPGCHYKVRVRARYGGYSGDWREIVEPVVADSAVRGKAKYTEVFSAMPTNEQLSNAVGALSGASSQPGELTVSWEAPDGSGWPYDLFTTGMSATEHQILEETPERGQAFSFLNMLSEPLRISDFRRYDKIKDLSRLCPHPASCLLAAPIRHNGSDVGSIYLDK